MEMFAFRVNFVVMAVLFLLLAVVTPSIHALAPAPAPANDGVAVDQGIAYVLMLVALVLTYIIH